MIRLPKPLFVAIAVPALLLAGCGGGSGTAPTAGFTSGSGDCKSTKAEMNKLVAQGVGNDVSAQEAGRKLSPAAQDRVDRYNSLLDVYLGGRCHVQ